MQHNEQKLEFPSSVATARKIVAAGDKEVQARLHPAAFLVRLQLGCLFLAVGSLLLMYNAVLWRSAAAFWTGTSCLFSLLVGWGVTKYFDVRTRQSRYLDNLNASALEYIDLMVEFPNPRDRAAIRATFRCGPELDSAKVNYDETNMRGITWMMFRFTVLICRAYVEAGAARWRPEASNWFAQDMARDLDLKCSLTKNRHSRYSTPSASPRV